MCACVDLRPKWTSQGLRLQSEEVFSLQCISLNISVELYCKTFNHNLVINLKLFTKTNQWDVKVLGATKRIKALQFVSQTNIYILICFNAMIDSRTLHCSILVSNTSRKLSCSTKIQNNKPISLSQFTSHCSGTMGYRLKGNRMLQDLFIYYLFVLFNGIERREFSSFGWSIGLCCHRYFVNVVR